MKRIILFTLVVVMVIASIAHGAIVYGEMAKYSDNKTNREQFAIVATKLHKTFVFISTSTNVDELRLLCFDETMQILADDFRIWQKSKVVDDTPDNPYYILITWPTFYTQAHFPSNLTAEQEMDVIWRRCYKLWKATGIVP